MNKIKTPWCKRLYSVWFRHFKVYSKHFFTNALPPFLEPLVFLFGIGFGLQHFVGQIEGLPFIAFMSLGLPCSSAMFTAGMECSYGTFIRLNFDKTYDGMLCTPIIPSDIFIGEACFAATKGAFFSSIVVFVITLLGILPVSFENSLLIFTPFIGFLTGMMFSMISFFMVSLVHHIDQMAIYPVIALSPMIYFAGILFPLSSLPIYLRVISEVLPLTHSVRMLRSLYAMNIDLVFLLDLSYSLVFIGVLGYFAIRKLEKNLID